MLLENGTTSTQTTNKHLFAHIQFPAQKPSLVLSIAPMVGLGSILYEVCHICVTFVALLWHWLLYKMDQRHKIDIIAINFLLTRKISLTRKQIARISQRQTE